MRVICWNVAWRKPAGEAGRWIRQRLRRLQPEILCLTEIAGDYGLTGHVITTDPDYGYRRIEGRRKGALFSRHPWSDVDCIGDPRLPGGRYVSGVTETSLGPVRVVALCISWSDAHVSTGRKDRVRWQDHMTYCETLPSILDGIDGSLPVIVIGDFNQTFPRSRAPKRAHEALSQALLPRFRMATAGPVPGTDRLLIDHVGLDSTLVPKKVRALGNFTRDGRRITDHIGAIVDVERA